jgi:hypothetical protein
LPMLKGRQHVQPTLPTTSLSRNTSPLIGWVRCSSFALAHSRRIALVYSAASLTSQSVFANSCSSDAHYRIENWTAKEVISSAYCYHSNKKSATRADREVLQCGRERMIAQKPDTTRDLRLKRKPQSRRSDMTPSNIHRGHYSLRLFWPAAIHNSKALRASA